MEQINLSETEWRRRLTPDQYHILREAGTERAFSGPFADHAADGVYRCAACRLDLFDSRDKDATGEGWPSFARPVAPDRVTDHSDTRSAGGRTETRCARCDSHLGHLVAGGAAPADRRYRVNSIALDFRPRR